MMLTFMKTSDDPSLFIRHNLTSHKEINFFACLIQDVIDVAETYMKQMDFDPHVLVKCWSMYMQ